MIEQDLFWGGTDVSRSWIISVLEEDWQLVNGHLHCCTGEPYCFTRLVAQGIAPILQMEEAGGREVLPQEAFGRAK